jgi:hypothetical protein
MAPIYALGERMPSTNQDTFGSEARVVEIG